MPSILIQKRVGSGWISVLVASFGIISFGTAFIHTFRQLIAIRILLGLAEGGLLVSQTMPHQSTPNLAPSQSGLVYILSRVSDDGLTTI